MVQKPEFECFIRIEVRRAYGIDKSVAKEPCQNGFPVKLKEHALRIHAGGVNIFSSVFLLFEGVELNPFLVLALGAGIAIRTGDERNPVASSHVGKSKLPGDFRKRFRICVRVEGLRNLDCRLHGSMVLQFPDHTVF